MNDPASNHPSTVIVIREGVRRIVVWLLLWLVLYVAGTALYNNSYTYTRDVLIHRLQVKPAAWVIQLLYPSMEVESSEAAITGGGIELNILRGCDGVEAWIVLITALVAFPAPWRRRVTGVLFGTLFIFSLNLIRIVSLFCLAQIKPAWFPFAHGIVWQTGILLASIAFVLWWHTPDRTHAVVQSAFRVMATFTVAVTAVSLVPAWWLKVVAPLLAWINNVMAPYLSDTMIRVEGVMLVGTAQFHLGMPLVDGTVPPPLVIAWHYAASSLLHILVVALTAWAMPPMRARTRWIALPGVLLIAAMMSGVIVSIELQDQSLHSVATTWLPTVRVEATEANQHAKEVLNAWAGYIRGAKEWSFAGGNLFLGALAGFLGCAVAHLTNRKSKRPYEVNNQSIVRHVSFLMVLIVHAEFASPAMADDAVVPEPLVVFDFHQGADLAGWEIEDDVVMGGRSQGALKINDEGHAVFSGAVSLENNGGFSSMQWHFAPMDVSAYTSALLRVKGDGKSYQFRVESTPGLRHNYVYEFATSGEWETIEIPLSEMYAEHHGNRLDLPNYPGKVLSHVRFLIANGQAENFELLIDRIELK